MENNLVHCWLIYGRKKTLCHSTLSKAAHYAFKLSSFNDFVHYLSLSPKRILMLGEVCRTSEPKWIGPHFSILTFYTTVSIMQSSLFPLWLVKYAKIPSYIIHNVICAFIQCVTSAWVWTFYRTGFQIIGK